MIVCNASFGYLHYYVFSVTDEEYPFELHTQRYIRNSNVQGLGSTAKYLVPPANTRANFIILSFGVARCIKLGLFQDAAINMS